MINWSCWIHTICCSPLFGCWMVTSHSDSWVSLLLHPGSRGLNTIVKVRPLLRLQSWPLLILSQATTTWSLNFNSLATCLSAMFSLQLALAAKHETFVVKDKRQLNACLCTNLTWQVTTFWSPLRHCKQNQQEFYCYLSFPFSFFYVLLLPFYVNMDAVRKLCFFVFVFFILRV